MSGRYWHYVNPDSGGKVVIYPSSLGTGVIIELRDWPADTTANPAFVIRPQDVAGFAGKLREFAAPSAEGAETP